VIENRQFQRTIHGGLPEWPRTCRDDRGHCDVAAVRAVMAVTDMSATPNPPGVP
jgi:hypothetical protein